MKYKMFLRVLSLLVLLTSLIPVNHVVYAAPALPPVDMFQLPWEQGLAWVALDGFDNGSDRLPGSPHNYRNGGAIDFAPRSNMIRGENTSNFWVTAAADGTVYEISKCHLKIVHSNGWITEYQHLANFQVRLGDVVTRNQKLAVIANAGSQPVCAGSEPPHIPHLHFVLRPNMVGATFAGWEFRYNWFWNNTTFRKNGITVGLFKPLLNVFDSMPTPTPTIAPTTTPGIPPTATSTAPSGPYVSTTVNLPNINIGETALASVNLNNVPAEGYTSAEFTCTYNASLVEVSNVVFANLFGADPATVTNVPQAGSLIVAIAGSNGNKATTSGTAFTFDVKGLQAGQTALECTARISKGDNVLTDLPSIGTSLNVLGALPTPTTTTPDSPLPTFTSTPDDSPLPTFTPTAHASDWLTFTNLTYGFEFKYPPQGIIADGRTDTFARIDLPFVPGTNLSEKYLEVVVGENVTECKSPLQTQDPGVTVTINGISFLKQTGSEGAAGSLYQWVAYSTLRNDVCVSLDFILRSHDPGNFSTPPPVFDFAAESAVFEQIVETYRWLSQTPTATPSFETPLPVESPTPIFTSTPAQFPTATISPTTVPISGAVLTGQVIAVKVVTVRLYDTEDAFVAAVNANPDGTFRFDVAAGTYKIVATANGFLRIQGLVTLANGDVRAMPIITLLAGDIDDNNEIDQFDAMTIGINYNTIFPDAADLNADGIINVIDLELLARNYRMIGPVVWQ